MLVSSLKTFTSNTPSGRGVSGVISCPFVTNCASYTFPFSTVSVFSGIDGLYPFAFVVVSSATFIVGAVTFSHLLSFLTRTEITCCLSNFPSVKLPLVLSASVTLNATMLYCVLSIGLLSSSTVGTFVSSGFVGFVGSAGTYGITSFPDLRYLA